MKKILYIISKPPDLDFEQLLTSTKSSEKSVSAVLIQKGIGYKPSGSISCFVLEDDLGTDNGSDACSKIQYSDMLRMIFDSDTVISI